MPDAVDVERAAVTVTRPGKHMHFMAAPSERGCQFRDVRRNAAHSVRVQRFPGEHRDPHKFKDSHRIRIPDWFVF
jgi:hypothetical protein